MAAILFLTYALQKDAVPDASITEEFLGCRLPIQLLTCVLPQDCLWPSGRMWPFAKRVGASVHRVDATQMQFRECDGRACEPR